MKQNIVMFDFDNTLVDSLKYWYYIQNKKMFVLHNRKIDKAFPQKRSGLKNSETAELFIKITGIDKTPLEVQQEWCKEMEFYYKNKVKMLKGAKDYLLKLKSEGKRLVLASASDLSILKIALKHFGLTHIFDEIFTEQSIGKAKKETEFFEYCIKALGCLKEDVFFFEDSVSSLESALSIGIRCCGVVHKLNKQRIKKLNILTIKNYKNIEANLKSS